MVNCSAVNVRYTRSRNFSNPRGAISYPRKTIPPSSSISASRRSPRASPARMTFRTNPPSTSQAAPACWPLAWRRCQALSTLDTDSSPPCAGPIAGPSQSFCCCRQRPASARCLTVSWSAAYRLHLGPVGPHCYIDLNRHGQHQRLAHAIHSPPSGLTLSTLRRLEHHTVVDRRLISYKYWTTFV